MQLRKTTPCSKTFYQKRWIWKTRWCQRLAVKSKAFSNAKKNRNNGQEKCFADVINSLRKVGFLAFCVTRLIPHTFRPLSGAKWEWLMFEVLIIADNFLRRGNDNDVKKHPKSKLRAWCRQQFGSEIMHSAEGSENRWKLGAFGFRIMKRDRWNVINAQTHLSSIVRTERESHSFGELLASLVERDF